MDVKQYFNEKIAGIKTTIKRGEIYVQAVLIGAFKWVTSADNLKSINDQLPQIQQYVGNHLGHILGLAVALLILYVHVTHTEPVAATPNPAPLNTDPVMARNDPISANDGG